VSAFVPATVVGLSDTRPAEACASSDRPDRLARRRIEANAFDREHAIAVDADAVPPARAPGPRRTKPTATPVGTVLFLS